MIRCKWIRRTSWMSIMPTSAVILQQQRTSGDAAEMKLRYGVDIPKSRTTKTSPKPPQFSLEELGKRDALRCLGELQQAKILRAALSERQLNEVMVDFWSNHFNVDIRKNDCRALKMTEDRDVIRPHVLGKFRDILGASAKSPAMLKYLDNAENSVPRERSAIEKAVIEIYVSYKLGISGTGLIPDKEGPNENYGREILELHTLGVDGGYTQKDVEEVARCFTGWGVSGSYGSFEFKLDRHDKGAKTVLGVKIPAGGGIKDGEKVLDALARHPATARFISRKLCQRFVADEPPAALVERAAKVFTESDGDIRQVVETIITSPEFFSRGVSREDQIAAGIRGLRGPRNGGRLHSRRRADEKGPRHDRRRRDARLRQREPRQAQAKDAQLVRLRDGRAALCLRGADRLSGKVVEVGERRRFDRPPQFRRRAYGAECQRRAL